MSHLTAIRKLIGCYKYICDGGILRLKTLNFITMTFY